MMGDPLPSLTSLPATGGGRRVGCRRGGSRGPRRGWGVEEGQEHEERYHHSAPQRQPDESAADGVAVNTSPSTSTPRAGGGPRPVVGCGRTGAIALREMNREPLPTVMLAEWATWQERPSACLTRGSTAQHRFLNKAPSSGRLDA